MAEQVYTPMKGEMIKWLIRQSMGEELIASSVYHTRAIQAAQSGDDKTAKLFLYIADEEDGHYQEFNQRLSEFAPGKLLESTGQNWQIELKTPDYVLWRGKTPTGQWLYHVTRPEFLGVPVYGFTSKEVAFRDAIYKHIIPETTPIPG